MHRDFVSIVTQLNIRGPPYHFPTILLILAKLALWADEIRVNMAESQRSPPANIVSVRGQRLSGATKVRSSHLSKAVLYLKSTPTVSTSSLVTTHQPGYCRTLLLVAMFALVRTTLVNVVAFLLQSMFLIAAAQEERHLNITAISAANGRSTIECWQITRPFDISTDPGTAGTAAQQLGDLTNLTFTILPPRFDGGLHNAPFVQYVTCFSTIH